MKMRILSDGTLEIKDADSVQFQVICSWGRLTYDRKERQFSGPTTLELLDRIAGIVRLPPNIEEMRREMQAVREAVDRERIAENPVPLTKYPVKFDLYKHQIRAANMALLTFGFVKPEGGGQA